MKVSMFFADFNLIIDAINPLAREFCLSVCDVPEEPIDNR